MTTLARKRTIDIHSLGLYKKDASKTSCEGCFYWEDDGKFLCGRMKRPGVTVGVVLSNPGLCGPERKWYRTPLEV